MVSIGCNVLFIIYEIGMGGLNGIYDSRDKLLINCITFLDNCYSILHRNISQNGDYTMVEIYNRRHDCRIAWRDLYADLECEICIVIGLVKKQILH